MPISAFPFASSPRFPQIPLLLRFGLLVPHNPSVPPVPYKREPWLCSLLLIPPLQDLTPLSPYRSHNSELNFAGRNPFYYHSRCHRRSPAAIFLTISNASSCSTSCALSHRQRTRRAPLPSLTEQRRQPPRHASPLPTCALGSPHSPFSIDALTGPRRGT